MKPIDVLLLAPESWRPAETVSGRTSNRTSERELERIPLFARLGSAEVPGKLWDYSPFGFAILVPLNHPSGFRPQRGDCLQLRFDLGSGWLEARCQVENALLFRGGLRLGLSRMDQLLVPEPRELVLEAVKAVIGETPNPILYGEWCPVSVHGVLPGLALEMRSTDPTLVLLEGQEITVDLSLPSTTENTYRGRVRALGRVDDATLRFRLEPLRLSPGLPSALGEYLAFATGARPEALKELGFPTRFMRERLDFRFADSAEDFDKVLELRRDCRSEAGRPVSEESLASLTAQARSGLRILCGFHEERLVAAALLSFPRADVDPDALEVRAISLHQDYRRGDLLKALIEHIARIFVLSGRKRLVRRCDGSALPHYRRMGFRESPAARPGAGGALTMQLDREAVASGRGMPVTAWLSLFGNVAEDLVAKRLIEPSGFGAIALKAKFALKPWLPEATQAGIEGIFGELLMGKGNP